ncbi:MAG: hypothetical protein AMXMBFR58_28800 [Phycisphaerae bacterium]|nr:DMT family transporter [Phycisphaerales bacterium]
MSHTQLSADARRTQGVVMILLTLAGWTSIPLFLRDFAHGPFAIDAWTANGWRYGVSALLWAPVLVLGLWRRDLPKGIWRAALVPSIFNTIAQVAFAIAPYMVKPGLMTFSMRLQIIFLTVGAALLFPAERRVIRTGGYLSGMAMVMIGTAATLMFQDGGLGGGTAAGVAISIAAGLFYAFYGLSVRKSMQEYHPFTAFAVVSQYTAAAIVVLMVVLGDRHGMTVLDLPGTRQFLLVLSAVIGIGLGHTLYFASISRLGLAVAAGVVQLQPITVSIGSMLLFDERLNALQWIGGTIAIAGAVIMLLAQHRLKPVVEAEKTTPQTDAVLCGFCGCDLTGVGAGHPCPECGRVHGPAEHAQAGA